MPTRTLPDDELIAAMSALHAAYPEWTLVDYVTALGRPYMQVRAARDRLGIVVPVANPGAPGETPTARFRAQHAAHPDWTAPEHAAALDLAQSTVYAVARDGRARMPSAVHTRPRQVRPDVAKTALQMQANAMHHPEWSLREHAEALGISQTRAANARDVAGLVLTDGATRRALTVRERALRDRVRAYHAAHPNEYASQQARALGLDPQVFSRVATALRLKLVDTRRGPAKAARVAATTVAMRKAMERQAAAPAETSLERLRRAQREYPDYCAADHARLLGISRERIRQLEPKLATPLPVGKRRDPDHTLGPIIRDRVERVATLLASDPTLRSFVDLSARMDASAKVIRATLKVSAPALHREVLRRTAEVKRDTLTARARAVLLEDPTSPMSVLADRLGIPRSQLAPLVQTMEQRDGRSYREGRHDGRARRAIPHTDKRGAGART